MSHDHSHMTPEEFQKHLEEEHRMSPISEYLKEIVYGGNDGIVTTFAVVAGFNGASLGAESAQVGVISVVLFGLANLLADGSAMGLGNFLSVRSEQHLYRKHQAKEKKEIKNEPSAEYAETILILQNKGISKSDAQAFADLYEKNPDFWLEFMMDHELEMSNPLNDNPSLKAIATFGSFVIFGGIPLLPYFFQKGDLSELFMSSCIATFGALALLGLLRWSVTREKWYRAIGETILLGGISALIAYWVGSWFR